MTRFECHTLLRSNAKAKEDQTGGFGLLQFLYLFLFYCIHFKLEGVEYLTKSCSFFPVQLLGNMSFVGKNNRYPTVHPVSDDNS